MGDQLIAVHTVTINTKAREDRAEQPIGCESLTKGGQKLEVASPEDVLQILRSQPDRGALSKTLHFLTETDQEGFNIAIPGPLSARILNELVNTTLPDYWNTLEDNKKPFLSCLRSVAGVSAVLSNLKLSLSRATSKEDRSQAGKAQDRRRKLISLLEQLLATDSLAGLVWKANQSRHLSDTKRKLIWKDFVALVASGKIISTVAQVEDAGSHEKGSNKGSWLADGALYSKWLGGAVAAMTATIGEPDHHAWTAVAQLCGRSLGLGYPAHVVEEILTLLPITNPATLPRVHSLVLNLQSHEQRRWIECTLQFLTKQYQLESVSSNVSGLAQIETAAALLAGTISDSPPLLEKLTVWLSDPVAHSLEPIGCRRVALAVLRHQQDLVQGVLESNLRLFGETLFIKHAPLIHHEACAQVVLLSAGYVHRKSPMTLFTLARSSAHLNGTSNRLNASSSRARSLGMIVSMGISVLVDKPSQRMNFDVEEVKTTEATSFFALIHIDDSVGDANNLRYKDQLRRQSKDGTKLVTKEKSRVERDQSAKRRPVESVVTAMKGPRVVEVLSDSDEEDDLIPYTKPDSDPEDEDEDPTLVTRNKARAPVYVRDLIAGLQEKENFDRHHLALKNAASLIRRKTENGKEINDHAIELGTILAGLGDPFEIAEFPELRLQALIALLVSDAARIGPWMANQVFQGDYSLSQRATLLSTLGLGARELAGFKDKDDLNPSVASTKFPSKRLPERFHKLYSSERSPVQAVAKLLEEEMVRPLALQAADQMSGPNALKVRTFSSRMEVEKKRKKAIPNALAKVVAESFFFPLTGRWWQSVQSHGTKNIHYQPFLLSTFLKTLALILHASGPSTLSLPQMTSEFWDLLLSVRTNAANDVAVLEALLFALLTLLNMNEDKRRIAEEHSRQLVETQEWAELVFEKSSGGDKEGEKLKMLAASVLLETRDVVQKYQRLMVGEMMDY